MQNQLWSFHLSLLFHGFCERHTPLPKHEPMTSHILTAPRHMIATGLLPTQICANFLFPFQNIGYDSAKKYS